MLHAPRRRALVLVVTAISMLLGGVLLATPAQADIGDKTESCVTGEICLYYDSLSSSYTRHFYWGDMSHYNDYFWDKDNNVRTGVSVEDDVRSVWNRDTACYVKMWDIDDYGSWYVYAIVPRGYGDYISFDLNNGHSRC